LFDWPLPPRRVRRPVQDHIRFYVLDASAPFTQTDWKNPAPTRRSLDLRTFVQTRDLSLEEPPPPFLLTAWPNPYRTGQSPELRRLTDWRALSLEDAVDDTPQSLADWPTPPVLRRAVTLRTWTLNLLDTTLAPSATPFQPGAFPNPRLTPRASTLGTHTQERPAYYADDQPFALTAWPRPVVAPRRVPETWTSTLIDETLSLAQAPFVPTDRPNPQPRRVPTITWIDAPLGSTLNPGPDPIVQTDWPLFLARPPARDLRTWVETRKTYYEDETPAVLHTWPVPPPQRIPRGFGHWVPPQLGILGFPARADVLVRVRPDVTVIRVRPDPDVRIR